MELLSWLDTSFMSSPAQCYVLEGFYESCLAKVTLNETPVGNSSLEGGAPLGCLAQVTVRHKK